MADTNNGFHDDEGLRAGDDESTEEIQTDEGVEENATDDDMQNIYGKLISELSRELGVMLTKIEEENIRKEEIEFMLNGLRGLQDLARSNLKLTEQCTLRF